MADEREDSGSSGATQGEGGESRRHHHHHHHRSGTSSQSVVYTPSGSGSYSLRSFGKGGSRPPSTIPEGTLPVIVCSVIFTALLLAPVILVMFFRNKTLSETNYQLREKLGNLMSQIEEGGQKTPAAPAKPVPIARTRYVEEDPQIEPQVAVKPKAEVAEAATGTPHESDETIAAAVDMTVDEIKALRRDMRLLPNGMRMVEDEDGNTLFERDVIAHNLQNAFDLLAVGQKRDAEAIFDMIANAKPQWPYGHFFAGITSGNRGKIESADHLFSAARLIGAMTPEGELYSAQAALFVKSPSSASASINRMSHATAGGSELQIGPVYVPKSTPADILEKLRGIKGVGDVRVIDW